MLHLIPWDNDKILNKVGIKDTLNAIEIWDDFGVVSHGCETFGYGWKQKSAACDKFIGGWASFEGEYLKALQRLLDGPFKSYESVLDGWVKQLAPIVAEMVEKGKKPITMSRWEMGVETLKLELSKAKIIVSDTIKSLSIIE
jgi:hypothetical protein